MLEENNNRPSASTPTGEVGRKASLRRELERRPWLLIAMIVIMTTFRCLRVRTGVRCREYLLTITQHENVKSQGLSRVEPEQERGVAGVAKYI